MGEEKNGETIDLDNYQRKKEYLDVKTEAIKIIKILNTWWQIFSDESQSILLNSFLLPKLIKAVNNWEPMFDRLPIHSWIIPYFELIQKIHPDPKRKFNQISSIILTKLGNTLNKGNWRVTDTSAVAIFTPLIQLFSENLWRTFVQRNFYQKFKDFLNNELTYDFQDSSRRNGNFRFFTAWWKIFDLQLIESLLENCVFPALISRLQKREVRDSNEVEIAQYYWSWREVLFPLFLQSKLVLNRMTTILLIIQKSYHLNKQQEILDKKFHNTVNNKNIYNNTGRNFRDLLEKKCQEYNLVFMPGKTMNGKVLYKIGLHWCYIERDVVFKNSTGEPVSLMEIESLNYA